VPARKVVNGQDGLGQACRRRGAARAGGEVKGHASAVHLAEFLVEVL
jgi:hypothetical protein